MGLSGTKQESARSFKWNGFYRIGIQLLFLLLLFYQFYVVFVRNYSIFNGHKTVLLLCYVCSRYRFFSGKFYLAVGIFLIFFFELNVNFRNIFFISRQNLRKKILNFQNYNIIIKFRKKSALKKIKNFKF